MRIALVFNPFSYKRHEENIRTVQRYFGLFPPLSLAWVAAIIRRAGHEVTIIDARTLRLSMDETATLLKRYRPDIIGAMMTTYMFPETLSWLRFLKNELAASGAPARVLIGGYNLSVYPRESMTDPVIDFACAGHAYYTVPRLLEELNSGSPDLSSVPGLIWRKGGEIVHNLHPEKIDFDKFPNPARDLLPNSLYAEFPTQNKNFTVMITSLGCPHRCSFCEAGGTEYSPRSPETVVNEMKECVERYGVREIDIFDYNFTAIPARVSAICRGIRENGLKFTWACRSRIDNVDEALLREMHAAGCRRIYWGIEHGNQDILFSLNKRIPLEKTRETLRLSRGIGIQNLGFFLIGVPGETRETVRQTIAFAKSLDLDYAQFSKLLAKPNTAMWKQMVEGGWKDYWSEWVAGRETDRELPRPWLAALDNESVDRIAVASYLRFYARPLFLLKHALRCRSPHELFRKFFALVEMIRSRFSRHAGRRFIAYPENLLKVSRCKHAVLSDAAAPGKDIAE